MARAKGVLPRGDDREVLYRNPKMCGYFVGVKLDPALDRPAAEAWLTALSALVDELVAREEPQPGEEKGAKVAAVAVGLAPSFFRTSAGPRFDPPVEPPAAFDAGATLPNAVPPLRDLPLVDADVLLYVASVYEARVNAFVTSLAAMRPAVVGVHLERGYQRTDDTEPFGYADGVRNIRRQERPRHVYVDRDTAQLEEPRWADGGTYMAYLKILQRPDRFAALPDDAARDAVFGRIKDGTRLDLVGTGIDPQEEPPDPPHGLQPTSHVRKVWPRAPHGDVQIFRRGLPFLETSAAGDVRVGLQFCSFQASLAQFDVMFNDWMASTQFPHTPGAAEPGVDALLNPNLELTRVEKVGFFFVPPQHPEGLAAAVFAPSSERRPRTGRLVVHKRVHDPNDPTRRFERAGFTFDVLDANGAAVPGSTFTTDTTGRGVCDAELAIGSNYTLRELSSALPNIELQNIAFTMDRPTRVLHVLNTVTQPGTPYAG